MPTHPRSPQELWAEMLKRRTVTENECWEYNLQRNAQGYGKVKWLGKTIGAHRVAAAICLGAPLQGREIQVCHKCDNPPCFNPKHLYIGNASTNALDSIFSGRHKEARKTHCPKGHPY